MIATKIVKKVNLIKKLNPFLLKQYGFVQPKSHKSFINCDFVTFSGKIIIVKGYKEQSFIK